MNLLCAGFMHLYQATLELSSYRCDFARKGGVTSDFKKIPVKGQGLVQFVHKVFIQVS